MTVPVLNTTVRGRGGNLGRPSLAFGSFILNGAGAVTDVTGIVASVERLIDDSSTFPFFRVTFNAAYKWARPSGAKASRGANGMRADPISPAATSITTQLGTGTLATSAPVAALSTQEDFIILNNGAPHDTAGTIVSLQVMFDY